MSVVRERQLSLRISAFFQAVERATGAVLLEPGDRSFF